MISTSTCFLLIVDTKSGSPNFETRRKLDKFFLKHCNVASIALWAGVSPSWVLNLVSNAVREGRGTEADRARLLRNVAELLGPYL